MLWQSDSNLSALVHHSDRGFAQYLSLAYTDRLAELGIAPSVGSRGDSYDNALARGRQRRLQDRADQPRQTLAIHRRRRTRHRRMGVLVQRGTPARSGFCYTAFVTDACSRKIVGWAEQRL